ncbi:unnamed protein product [Polarella glacialis]|uniref:Pentatricopeptide repeat-containing protein, chloroplastic n=1 Tax=Polarella glacialis TaxID=89957 RepID=A0A813JKB4_POLGL|nr:unnamed protein product [Polarella glacialis]
MLCGAFPSRRLDVERLGGDPPRSRRPPRDGAISGMASAGIRPFLALPERGGPPPFRGRLQGRGHVGRHEAVVEALEELGKQGLQLSPKEYTVAISKLGRCGLWQKAILLLEDMRSSLETKPDLIATNAAVSACNHGGAWQPALALLNQAGVDGRFACDVVSFNAAMSACGRSGAWTSSVGLLACLKRQRLEPDLISYSAATSAAEKAGPWALGLSVLAEVQSRALRPDIVLCNAALSACAKGAAWVLTISLLLAMQRRPGNWPCPDLVSFSAALSACEKVRDWKLAFELLRTMRVSRAAVADLVAWNTLLNACAAGRAWVQALQLISSITISSTRNNDVEQKFSLTPDVVSYTTAINACGGDVGGSFHSTSYMAQWEHALVLLLELGSHGLRMDARALAAGIGACGSAQRWELATKLLCRAQSSRLRPSAEVLGVTLGALQKGSQWQGALQLWKDLPTGQRQGGFPQVGPSRDGGDPLICFNTVLASCQRAGLWRRAVVLLANAQDQSLRLDLASFGAAIATCAVAAAADTASKGNACGHALALLGETRRLRFSPDLAAYNSVLASLAAVSALGAQRWQSAWAQSIALLAELRQAGYQPSAISLNTVLRCCASVRGNSSSNCKSTWRRAWDLLLTSMPELRLGQAPGAAACLAALERSSSGAGAVGGESICGGESLVGSRSAEERSLEAAEPEAARWLLGQLRKDLSASLKP